MSKPGADPSSGISSEDVLIPTERHPTCRRREARPGSGTERENLAGDGKGKKHKWLQPRGRKYRRFGRAVSWAYGNARITGPTSARAVGSGQNLTLRRDRCPEGVKSGKSRTDNTFPVRIYQQT